MKWQSTWDEHNLVSVDHIIPKVNGGTKVPGMGNVALACRRCNTRKGDRYPTACEILYGHILAEITGELTGRKKIKWPPKTMNDSQ